MVAIYSTLGLATTLAEVLREHGLLPAALFLFWHAARGGDHRHAGGEGAAGRGRDRRRAGCHGLPTCWCSSGWRVLEERTHLIEYGVVGVFIHAALAERASQGRRVPLPPLLAILATAALGLLDECIQAFLPSRVFDPQDILFNLLAGTMAVAASVALAWARRWRGKEGKSR